MNDDDDELIILNSFLWRDTKNGLKAYSWTGMNEYMILSETEFIAIGGG
jgi:hypothetical protein